jgi:hypothetical protein
MSVDWVVNLAMGAVLVGAWVADLARSPAPDGPAMALHAAGLSGLEDAFAHHPEDGALAQRLAQAYLAHDRPGLAVAALRTADPVLLRDPHLVHTLAQAYEASGRLEDAHATAELALARCIRASAAGAHPPGGHCDASTRIDLDVHRTALAHMVGWGVTDPGRDPRARTAYDLAMRKARIASAFERDRGDGWGGQGAALAQ